MPDDICPPQTKSLLIPAHPLLGREENMKLLFDNILAVSTDGMRNASDWSNSRARTDIRSERNAVGFDKAMDTVLALAIANLTNANQTGDTTEQTANGPEHTAEGAEDTANAGVAVSAQAVATSLGNLATAMVPIITATAGVVTAQSLAAMLATVVAAIGNSAGTSK
jgi:hypothetical protein